MNNLRSYWRILIAIPLAISAWLLSRGVHLPFAMGWRGTPQPVATATLGSVGQIQPLIPETTKILQGLTLESLTEISEGQTSLVFSQPPAGLDTLPPGSVVVSEATELAPDGLLLRVTSTRRIGDQVVLETTRATLEEALEAGTLQIAARLSADDFGHAEPKKGITLQMPGAPGSGDMTLLLEDALLVDRDGDESTTSDQVRANGSLVLSPSFDFVVLLEGSRVRELRFVGRTLETVSLTITSSLEALDIHRDVTLQTLYFDPITARVGTLPVVVRPVLGIHLGFDGSLTSGMALGIEQQAAATTTLDYRDTAWLPSSEFSNSFDPVEPSLFARSALRASAYSELTLLLYGAPGPQSRLTGYVDLNADPLDTPWWQLDGGLAADAGVKAAALGQSLSDHTQVLFDHKTRIATAKTVPPPPLFEDVPFSHPYHDFIRLLYLRGYAAGCSTSPLRYCPDSNMTRAEMAVFIERGLHGPGWTPPDPTEAVFADIPVGSTAPWYAKWAYAFWGDRLSAGCRTNPLMFCPDEAFSRSEACVVFLRMRHGPDFDPDEPAEQLFADVPVGSQAPWYASWVHAAYFQALIKPCQEPPQIRFCPDYPLTRSDAAYMLYQAIASELESLPE